MVSPLTVKQKLLEGYVILWIETVDAPVVLLPSVTGEVRSYIRPSLDVFPQLKHPVVFSRLSGLRHGFRKGKLGAIERLHSIFGQSEVERFDEYKTLHSKMQPGIN